jgi:ABC-type amino acid transport system permease subunit
MFPREAYLFVGIVYFVFSYIMAEASRRIEKTGSGAIRRETI